MKKSTSEQTLEEQYQQYVENIDFINQMRSWFGKEGKLPKSTFDQWVKTTIDWQIKCYENRSQP